MDELIHKLRSSGYAGLGLSCSSFGNVFTGCIMYADDMLLACSCFGLQQLVGLDICEQYGNQ